jgi:sarcosine oxidase subunit beta
MIDVADAKRLSPLIDTDGRVAAVFSPDDGHCTPESVVLGYATAARGHGAVLLIGVTVTGLDVVSDEARP